VEGFHDFQKDVETQLEEIANLLESFQEKVEAAETEQGEIVVELKRQTGQTQIVADSVKETAAEFAASQKELDALLTAAVEAKTQLTELVSSGGDVLRLENTVARLQTDLAKAQNVIEELESRDISLSEQHYQSTQTHTHQLKAAQDDLADTSQRLKHLREAYDQIAAQHKDLQEKAYGDSDVLRRELERLKKRHREVTDELETKEEVHTALKENLEQLASKCDQLNEELEVQRRQEREMTSRTDQTIDALEGEIARLKTSWAEEVQKLNQTRYERDQLHAKLTAYEQKVAKLSTDNEKMKVRIEELKVEARANLEASHHPVSVDKSVRSATGTVARLELDHRREIEELERRMGAEVEKLNEELVWTQKKLREAEAKARQ